MQEAYELDLNGVFTLRDRGGQEIKISPVRCRALVALLATAPNKTRSRVWLQTALWPRSPQEQASNSLRNALSVLRAVFGKGQLILRSDRSVVCLPGVRLAPFSHINRAKFFEDAPDSNVSEDFEYWLQDMRSAWDEPAAPSLVSQRKDYGTDRQSNQPILAFAPPRVHSNNRQAQYVADSLCDDIVTSLNAQGLVTVLDLRDASADQPTFNADDVAKALAVLVRIDLTIIGSQARFSVRASDPTTGRMVWSSTLEADQSGMLPFSATQLQDFAQFAADSIQFSCLNRVSKGTRQGPTLFLATHQIMGMSVGGQHSARSILESGNLLDGSGLALAWYAFTSAYSVGEYDPEFKEDQVQQIRDMCRRALEMEPFNPIVLALTSHVFGFVLNDLNTAKALSDRAKQAGPQLALVWDLAAMNSLYIGREDQALTYALRANRLGRYSPYKPLFDSSLAMSAAANGQHKRAIEIGRQVLAQRPGFMGVHRHICGSYAALGMIEESRASINEIRRLDPEFHPRAAGGVLLAQSSRDLVQLAFDKTQISI